MPLTVTLLGLGLWGRCLRQLIERNGHSVQGWSRSLGGDPVDALRDADLVVSAVSMAGVPQLAARLAEPLGRGLPLISCSKGIAPGSLATALMLWRQHCPTLRGLVLSGPNLSVELSKGLPAATVLAGEDGALGEELQKALSSDQLRIYRNDDPIGTEVAAALKNVMAIAAGVSDGLSLGANAKASLLCRGLAEMASVIEVMGGQPETLFGLAGLGDLLATANSPLSRNYRFGLAMGQGASAAEALARCESTVEGCATTRAVTELASCHGFPVPIARQVLELMEQRNTPAGAVKALMERDLQVEQHLPA
ncbi:MAG: NAD(P)H-dependent glycerol-3-phosphate dehydrogenase [Aphanocapsa feldmannii 277cV]|uniref:Glycerol-3-phosphate dehydrogenase [NAD(P)+] n=1 Tax=Aphanocapsa feldmannii 277cV TaxID=2507553 RepID=A0A524RNU5_9CHRO|nr:MAG: NAD(P)H-dependent glycerol-3-phosphate dehydrogenase [Aphanocapsa feldmannii 288cV]TGG93024.1 MAG: NAD(P)H-dependent glycerol-3-phosphate dehydrogenase [Aphanocapsa feldmannii 277cV]